MDQHVTLKNLRPTLPKVIRQVDERLDRFFISKNGRPVAVLLSLSDYESMLETMNETADKANLRRLKKAMSEARQGRTIPWGQVKKSLGLD